MKYIRIFQSFINNDVVKETDEFLHATTSRIYVHAIQSADAAAADTLHNILPLPKKNDEK
ncbi:MAG: hypothetical protein J6K17_14190 [Oscillospiraceae bacterium]|nr:hypothetical protein [Oscillospiraceae bacterium]